MAERKTALKNNPSVKKVERTEEQKTAARKTRLQYLMKVRPNDPEIKKLQQQLGPQATPGAAGPTPATQGPAPIEPSEAARNVYGNMAEYYAGFDPRTFQQQYQPQFQEQMDKAYNAVMSQFDIRNQRAFEQQKQDLDQEAAMKGWDPAGANYQRRYREMMDAQNQARQEAQNAATQQAYNVNQQIFQQSQQAALLPSQIAGQFENPMMARYTADLTEEQAQKQFGRTKEQLRLEQRYALERQAKMPRGGGGGAAPAYDALGQYQIAQLQQQYAPQQQQPNPGAQAGQAALTSFGAVAANQLGKKILG